jgi:exopolyphosphatase / guanosine-5'-triphosphate,3'-diphosphate pyrophosphatase
MSTIIPRWEWRTFGAEFGVADAKFAALITEKVQESDEIYLLSPLTDANVKIRADLMDLKTLDQVGQAGLEQWRPVMKGAFPLPIADVSMICTALGVPPPAGRDAFTLDQLLAELGAPGRGVRAVAVHKRRLRYTINGCTAEMTEVVADGTPVRTVAIESEDAGRVVEAVREMGLAGFENISYPRGLKAVVGMKG